MAGSKSDYLEKALLAAVLGAATYTSPTNIAIALSTAAYTDAATGASMTEVTNSATAYARVSQTNNTTNWPTPTGTSPTTTSNGVAATFPTATASWGTILSAYLVDSATYGAGNVLYGGDLAASKSIGTGDTASFPIGSIVATED